MDSLSRAKKRTARIGLAAVAHKPYWNQFEGLLESLLGFHKELCDIVEGNEVEIVDYGMIDTNAKGFEVLQKMKGDNLDLIFCNMVTYATSSVFAPIIQGMDVPIVMVGLQPLAAMDYDNACTFMQLQNDSVCAMPEFSCAAERLGKKYADVIIGRLNDDDKAYGKIKEWCEIAKVLHSLKGARVGLVGHVMEAMYDMHTDPTAITSAFGIHVPLLEIDDIVEFYNTAEDSEIKIKMDMFKEIFDMPEPRQDPLTIKVTDEDLESAARAAVALDKFIEANNLTGLAYYYEGKDGSAQQKVVSSFILGNSVLNAQGIPMCGEFDIKTCIAMLIMDRLNIGGSFAELHPFDFNEDYILVGHDGPHHIAIADGKPSVRSLKKYHGKRGSGASVEFKIKEGPFTMLGITQKSNGSFKFVIGEGQSIKGAIPPTGNTNTRAKFEPNTCDFITAWIKEGATHHLAIGVGYHAETIKKIGEVLGVETVIVKA